MLAGSHTHRVCWFRHTIRAACVSRMGVARSESPPHVVVARDPCMAARRPSRERQRRRCVRRDDCGVAPAAEAASDQSTRPGRAARVGITRGERRGVRPLRCCCLPMPTVIERHRHRGLPAVGSHRIPAYDRC